MGEVGAYLCGFLLWVFTFVGLRIRALEGLDFERFVHGFTCMEHYFGLSNTMYLFTLKTKDGAI